MSTTVTWPGGKPHTVADCLLADYLVEQLRLKGWRIAILGADSFEALDEHGQLHTVLTVREN